MSIIFVGFLYVEELMKLYMDQTCRQVITFPGFVDTMYRDTPNELLLDNGFGTKLSIKNEGFVSFSRDNFFEVHFFSFFSIG